MRLLLWYSLSYLVVASLAVSGCTSPQEEFLAGCDSLVGPAGNGVAGTGIPSALGFVEEAEQLGIDLYELYQHNLHRQDARLSLAYLLLLKESEEYLGFARDHRQQFRQSREFFMWVWVLNQEYEAILKSKGIVTDEAGFPLAESYKGHLSEDYRESMRCLLVEEARVESSAPFVPYLELVMAETELASGKVEPAVESLLDIVCGGGEMGPAAYEVLYHVPSSLRATPLLPYLQHKSREGAYAASLLAANEETGREARAYLESLKGSGDAALVAAAKDANQLLAYWSKD